MKDTNAERLYRIAQSAAKVVGHRFRLSREDMEDVASEAYIYLFPSWRGAATIVHTKVMQLCIDRVRAEARAPKLVSVHVETEELPDTRETGIPPDIGAAMWSDRDRAIATGLALGLTAEELGVSRSSVSRFRRRRNRGAS